MDRKKALAAETEDELLMQQQAFLSNNKAPAAAVTRVTRVARPAAAADGASSGMPTGASPPDLSSSNDIPHGKAAEVINMAVSDVMGEIQERPMHQPPPSGSADRPGVGMLAPSATAFPVAVHRRESKFALSRKAPIASATRRTNTHAPGTAALAPAVDAPAPHSGPPAPSPGTPTGGLVARDPDGIHQQNLGVVSGMSSTQVQEAVEELSSRLPASTLAFLKARGARKAGTPSTPGPQAQVGPQLAGNAVSVQRVAHSSGASGQSIPNPPSQLTCSASTTAAPLPAAATPGSVPGTVAGQRPVQAQGPSSGPDAGLAQGPDDPQSLPADPRLHARVRWGLGGEALGVQAREEVQTAARVLMRDQLRKDEGSVPEGHTITELLLLARSSHPPQRIAALRMLRAVLTAARPTPQDSGSLGTAPCARPVPMPTHLLDAHDLRQPAPTWQQVWAYLVTDLGAASHLRLALDDPQLQVAGAAAAALAALVAGGPEEAVQWEALECCPRLGWPVPRQAPLTRTVAGATWAAQAVVQQQAARQQRQAEGDEEERTPEDVGTVDPVAGLVQMQVLPRVCYLLSSTQPSAGHTHHMLAVLEAVAAHSEAAAMEMVRCPGLLEQLKALLLPHAQPEAAIPPAQGQTEASPAGVVPTETPVQQPQQVGQPQLLQQEQADTGGGSGAVGAAVQALALRVLRLICSSSVTAAQLMRTAGLIPSIQGHLLVSCAALAQRSPATGAHSTTACGTMSPQLRVQHALVAVEALRLWRVCVSHGISLMSFEGMHTVLCPLMTPPPLLAPSSTTGGSQSIGHMANGVEGESQGGDGGVRPGGVELLGVLRWHLAREVHVLLDAVLSHALAIAAGDRSLGAPMIQPGTAAALASEAAASWLSEHALRCMATHMATLHDMLPAAGGGPMQWKHWHSEGLHPLLLLPPATAAVSCWAAALHAAATYWCTIPAAPAGVWAPLTAAVNASGLLPAQHHTASSQPMTHTQPSNSVHTAAPTGQPSAATGPTWQHSTRHVALALLQQQRGPVKTSATQDNCRAMGRAILSTCSEQLVVVAGGRGKEGGMRCGLPHPDLVLAPHQVAVAELLAGLLRLAQALPHTPDAASPAPPAHHQLAQLLLPGLAQHLVDAVAAHHLGSSTGLQPWQSAALATWQPKVRLMLRVADLCGPSTTSTSQSSATGAGSADNVQSETVQQRSDTSSEQPEATGGSSCEMPDSPATANGSGAVDSGSAEMLAVTDALLTVLVVSPPGAEMQCLTALRLLTAPARLQHLLHRALTASHALKHTCPVLHLSAAGVGFHAMASSLPPHSNGSADTTSSPADPTPNASHEESVQGLLPAAALTNFPYPPPDSLDTAATSRVLFDGWAAAWLSMVAVPEPDTAQPSPPAQQQQRGEQPQASAGRASRAVQRFPSSHLNDVGESRLPAPPTWHMGEVLVVPPPLQAARGPSRGAAGGRTGRAPSVHPVAAALMHVCALEAAGSHFLSRCCGGAGAKLSPALHLAYAYNSMELAQQQRMGGPTHDDQHEQTDAQAAQWMEPSVRWPLAALTWRYACGPLPPGWCSVRLAERLAQQFGSSSFGDSLYAQHIALLLTPGTAAPVQQAVWTCLAQDQALHLLPPVALCVAPIAAQLRAHPCKDPGVVGAFAHSLTTGELRKAQAYGGVAAVVAAVTVLAYVCDPLGAARCSGSGSAISDSSTVTAHAGEGPAAAFNAEVRSKAALRAASIARGLVQSLSPAELQGLLAVAAGYGMGGREVGAALVQACRGDAQLMDKLKHILT